MNVVSRNEVRPLKQHIKEIDLIRGLACLAVIFVHLTASPINELTPGSPAMLLLLFLNRALKFTTPVLIFVSGFLLMHAYEQEVFRNKTFLKGRLKKLFWPYVTWSIIYGASFAYFKIMPFDPIDFIKRLLLADMNYHMYFVAVIFQCYLAFGVLRKWLLAGYKRQTLAVAFIVNVFFMGFGNFPYSDRFILKYILFFVLGMYIAMDWQGIFSAIKRQKHWVLGVYTGSCVLYGMNYYSALVDDVPSKGHFEPLTWLFFCLASLPMLYLGAQKILREYPKLAVVIAEISAATFYIYLAHPFVLYGIQYLLNQMGQHGLLDRLILEGVLVYGITLSGGIGYNRLKHHFKGQREG